MTSFIQDYRNWRLSTPDYPEISEDPFLDFLAQLPPLDQEVKEENPLLTFDLEISDVHPSLQQRSNKRILPDRFPNYGSPIPAFRPLPNFECISWIRGTTTYTVINNGAFILLYSNLFHPSMLNCYTLSASPIRSRGHEGPWISMKFQVNPEADGSLCFPGIIGYHLSDLLWLDNSFVTDRSCQIFTVNPYDRVMHNGIQISYEYITQ